MPTIGQLDFAVAGSGLAFALANFDCGNFLSLVFIREEDALDIAFRFAAMRPFYVRLGLPGIQAAIASGGTHWPHGLLDRLRLCRLIFTRSAMDVQGQPAPVLWPDRSSCGLDSRRRRPHSGETFFDKLALNLPVFECREQELVRWVTSDRFIGAPDFSRLFPVCAWILPFAIFPVPVVLLPSSLFHPLFYLPLVRITIRERP